MREYILRTVRREFRANRRLDARASAAAIARVSAANDQPRALAANKLHTSSCFAVTCCLRRMNNNGTDFSPLHHTPPLGPL